MNMKNVFVVAMLLVVLCSILYAQGEADNSTSLTRLGIMKVRGGDYEGGIKLLDKAINMDKENTLAYYQRGRAKAGMGNYKEAIADFDITIKLQSDYAPVYVERADAKRKLGDEEGAKKDMDIAVKLDPSYLKPPEEVKIEVAKAPEPDKNKEDLSQKAKQLSLLDQLAKVGQLSEKELTAERY